MSVFYLTFGLKYASEPHPVLGDRPDLPDGWIAITAPTMSEARAKVAAAIGTAWCGVYEPDNMRTDYYPAGCLGNLDNMIAELCECFEVDPKYWTATPQGTEPGSTVEWNPDCPVHKPNELGPNVPF